MYSSTKLLLLAALLGSNLQLALGLPVAKPGYSVTKLNVWAPNCPAGSTSGDSLCKKSLNHGLLRRSRFRTGNDFDTNPNTGPGGSPGSTGGGPMGAPSGPGSTGSRNGRDSDDDMGDYDDDYYDSGEPEAELTPEAQYNEARRNGETRYNALKSKLQSGAAVIPPVNGERHVFDDFTFRNPNELPVSSIPYDNYDSRASQTIARVYDDLGLSSQDKKLDHSKYASEEINVEIYTDRDQGVVVIANIEKDQEGLLSIEDLKKIYASQDLYDRMRDAGIDRPRHIVQDQITNSETRKVMDRVWETNNFPEGSMQKITREENPDDWFALNGSPNGAIPVRMAEDNVRALESDVGPIWLWKGIRSHKTDGTEFASKDNKGLYLMSTEFVDPPARENTRLGLGSKL